VAEDTEAKWDFDIVISIFGAITLRRSATCYPREIGFFDHLLLHSNITGHKTALAHVPRLICSKVQYNALL
jgi:hypothetical protein